MAKTGEKLSKLLDELPEYFIHKGRVECPNEFKQRVLKELVEQAKGSKYSTLDGIKIWFKDKSGILIRPSGTEPVYRLYAEAKTAEKATQLVKEYSSGVARIVDELKT